MVFFLFFVLSLGDACLRRELGEPEKWLESQQWSLLDRVTVDLAVNLGAVESLIFWNFERIVYLYFTKNF